MGVVQGERAHAVETDQRPRPLVTPVVADFSDAHRQVAVAAKVGLVDDDVVRAVDGAQLELLAVFENHRRVHVFLVELRVAARPVKVETRDVRRAHVQVPARKLLVDDEALQLAPDRGAVGQPQRQARANALVDGEELQLLAEPLVVALLGLLEELQVVVELLRRGPGRAVDACELGLLLVAAPVRAGDPQQLERLDVARRRHVRASAEVEEVARVVHADIVALDLVGDELKLVVLAAPRKLGIRLGASQRLLHERASFLRDAAHS